MTLKELLKDQKLPCYVINNKWSISEVIKIIAYEEKIDTYVGFDDKIIREAGGYEKGWELYTEPKKLVKKKMYLSISFYKDKNTYFVNQSIYNTPEEALKGSPVYYPIIGYQEIEVDVYE